MSKQFCVPGHQRAIHIGGEVLALVINVPILLEVSRHEGPLTKRQRRNLKTLAVGTLIVDAVFDVTLPDGQHPIVLVSTDSSGNQDVVVLEYTRSCV